MRRVRRGPPPRRRRRRAVVGVLERRDPLPPARYWVDAVGDDAVGTITAWLLRHADTIRLHRTEPGSAYDPVNRRNVATKWVLFDVVQPTERWRGPPGYPNLASTKVKTAADVLLSPKEVAARADEMSVIPEGLFEGVGTLLALWLLYEITR